MRPPVVLCLIALLAAPFVGCTSPPAVDPGNIPDEPSVPAEGEGEGQEGEGEGEGEEGEGEEGEGEEGEGEGEEGEGEGEEGEGEGEGEGEEGEGEGEVNEGLASRCALAPPSARVRMSCAWSAA